jgi:hypothetical protein
VPDHAADHMVRLEQRLFGKEADVEALGRVERSVPLSSDAHKSRVPKLGKVLGNACRTRSDVFGELAHRVLAVEQGPDDP